MLRGFTVPRDRTKSPAFRAPCGKHGAVFPRLALLGVVGLFACGQPPRPVTPPPPPPPAVDAGPTHDLSALRGTCLLQRGRGCEEYHGGFSDPWLASRRADCRRYHGTWSTDTGCPEDNALGGCRLEHRARHQEVESFQVSWHYVRGPACSSAVLRRACADESDGTFVPPARGELDLCDGGVN